MRMFIHPVFVIISWHMSVIISDYIINGQLHANTKMDLFSKHSVFT